MTTNNPFGSTSSVTSSDQTSDFTIRTMKDDLLSLKNQPQGDTTKIIQEVPERKATEATSFAQAPQPTSQQAPKSPAPFFTEEETEAPKTVANDIQPKTALPEKKIADATTPFLERQKTSTKPSAQSFGKLISALVSVLIIAIVGAGGFYFWKSNMRKNAEVADQATPVAPESEISEEPEVIVTPPTEKYSSSKTNYLVVDLTTANPEDIKKSITDAIAEINDAPNGSLYEFIIVDANNNPVAFPIFATASKINLSAPVLSSLNEKFSLFAHKEASGTKLGIAVKQKNSAPSIIGDLLKEEKTLPKDIAFFFLGKTIAQNNNVFKDSNYKNAAIRYLNLSEDNSLSIDYSVKDGELLIGTSKDTLRNIIDYLENTK